MLHLAGRRCSQRRRPTLRWINPTSKAGGVRRETSRTRALPSGVRPLSPPPPPPLRREAQPPPPSHRACRLPYATSFPHAGASRAPPRSHSLLTCARVDVQVQTGQVHYRRQILALKDTIRRPKTSKDDLKESPDGKLLSEHTRITLIPHRLTVSLLRRCRRVGPHATLTREPSARADHRVWAAACRGRDRPERRQGRAVAGSAGGDPSPLPTPCAHPPGAEHTVDAECAFVRRSRSTG